MELQDRQLAKLTIEAYKDQNYTESAGEPWYALFNPTELGFTRKNRYNATPSAGSSQPQVSYGGGEPDEVSIDLFFDDTGVVDSPQTVVERIDALLELAKYHGDPHKPYYLHVYWGHFDFRGVLTQADVRYTLFDRSRKPLRATVRITVREAIAPEEVTAQEENASADLYQTWLVTEGERIEHIAHSVYGSVDFWRPLASVNELRNPRALYPGQVLVLPPRATA